MGLRQRARIGRRLDVAPGTHRPSAIAAQTALRNKPTKCQGDGRTKPHPKIESGLSGSMSNPLGFSLMEHV